MYKEITIENIILKKHNLKEIKKFRKYMCIDIQIKNQGYYLNFY